MSPREWLLSALIAFHLLAVTLAAIPRPINGSMRSVERSDRDPIAAAVAPPLTAIAERLNRAQRKLYRATARVRQVTRAYTGAVLPQNWSMFSDVLRVQRYLRLDYVVHVPGQMPTMYQQLVLPSQVEGEPRLVYRSADKAVRVVMGKYLSRLRDEEESALNDDERPKTARLRPLLQHFTTRFAEQQGVGLEHITRVEIWAGSVSIPPPGEEPAFPAALRRGVLARYRTLAPQPAPPFASPLWATQQQGDLSWQLVHVEQRP